MNTKPYFRLYASVFVGIFAVGLFLFAFSLSPAGEVQAAFSAPLGSDITFPITSTNSAVYLPVAFHNFDPELPRLISPLNGAVLDTLIPTFSWTTGTQPPNTAGCFSLGTSPHPIGCQMSFWMDSGPSQWNQVMWYNLQPSTVYYWRVGMVHNDDYDHPEWIDERTFTTGQAGGPILPAPILTSPTNNSSISLANVILTWSPVDGAIEYSVSLLDKTIDSWYGFTTTTPQLDISGSGWFTPASNYEWYVEVRNNYAWSSPSTTWTFTTTADGLSTKNQRLPDVFFHDKPLDYFYYSDRH